MDSGCTNHMTGEKKMFSSLELGPQHHENITFDDNGKGKVIVLGKIAISKENDLAINEVLLVESLGYNLLSVA